MHPIEQQILDTIGLLPSQPIYVAYSGGVDSQVLLHALSQLHSRELIEQHITACHIHHGLNSKADEWQQFCLQQAQQRGVAFKTQNVEVTAKKQHSIEALAREARYQALTQMVPAQSLLLTGHHQDDQAETLLLALKRGAGISGLSAMQSQTSLFGLSVIRPLLNVSRAEIEAYASDNGLVHIEDDSNADQRFDRNFIRHSVLPLLQSRWPSIVQTMNRSSHHCDESQLILNEVAVDDIQQIEVEAGALSVTKLSELSKARFNNALRYYLKQGFSENPSSGQLLQIAQQCLAGQDKTPEIKLHHSVIRRFQDKLFVTPVLEDVSDWHYQLESLNTLIELPDALGELTFSQSRLKPETRCWQIQLPEPNQKVTIRFSHKNPKCLPDYRQHSQHLKKVLQELKIAPWLRKRIPFLYYDDQLVAALGYFVCKPFVASDGETNLSLYCSFKNKSR